MDEKKEKLEAEILENKEKTNDNMQENNEKNNDIIMREEEKNSNKVTLVGEVQNLNNVTLVDEEKNKNDKKKEQNSEKKNEELYRNKSKVAHKKNHKFAVLTIIVIIFLLAIATLSTIFAFINSNNNTILGGIYIGDVAVEGLTEEEAIKILNEKYQEQNKKEIALKINGEIFSITPEQIEVTYNIEKAVSEAYKVGRDGNIFENNFDIIQTMLGEQKIEIEFSYNEELLKNVLKGFNAKLPNAMVDNTYCVEEDELIITRGVDGIEIDVDGAKQAIISNIKTGNIGEVEIKTKFTKCPEINIEKIYSEVKTEPQNASYKTDPFEIIPHKNGIDFDIDEARKVLSEEKEEYVIKLAIIEPEIHTNEIGEEAFPDLLSSFSTKYDETNRSRSKNLKIAMDKLNGVVVMPGEVFSYNQTLGKRTAEQGYEYANGFAGGKVVPMLAGGICQISSTLYDAVLYANLNIVERHNHAFQATYVEPGKDATVVYGSLDFKFENTRNYPIMIKTTAKGGLAEIKIFGIREAVEYEVEVITEVLNYTPYNVVYQNDTSLAPGQQKVSQWGLQGCKSITYRIVSLNGQQVSKEVLSTDTYQALSKIIKVGPSSTTQETTVNTNETPVEIPQTPETPAISEEPEETVTTEPEVPETPTPTIPETPVETGNMITSE